MRFLTLRGALVAPVLLGILTFLAACDSNDPDGTDGSATDLFLLQPTYFSNVNFPVGGRGPIRTLPVATTDLTYTMASSVFDQVPVTTPAQEVNLLASLTNAGYSERSVYEVDIRDYATLTLEAPAEETLSFLNRVEVVFSADGLPDRVVGSESYFYGREAEIYINAYDVREYVLQPDFSVQLVLDPYQAPSATGTYRFGFEFDVQFRVYDGDPAPSEVTVERELYLRDALQQEGYDVGDVVSARVTGVAVRDAYSSAGSSLFDERVNAVRVLVGSTETEEMEEVAVLDTFEEETNPYDPPYTAARAEVDHDVTAVVRRTGRLRMEAAFDLDEAAAARGEYYESFLEVEVAFEVPVPEGIRSEDQPRTVELRVPMRVPVSADSSLGS